LVSQRKLNSAKKKKAGGQRQKILATDRKILESKGEGEGDAGCGEMGGGKKNPWGEKNLRCKEGKKS